MLKELFTGCSLEMHFENIRQVQRMLRDSAVALGGTHSLYKCATGHNNNRIVKWGDVYLALLHTHGRYAVQGLPIAEEVHTQEVALRTLIEQQERILYIPQRFAEWRINTNSSYKACSDLVMWPQYYINIKDFKEHFNDKSHKVYRRAMNDCQEYRKDTMKIDDVQYNDLKQMLELWDNWAKGKSDVLEGARDWVLNYGDAKKAGLTGIYYTTLHNGEEMVAYSIFEKMNSVYGTCLEAKINPKYKGHINQYTLLIELKLAQDLNLQYVNLCGGNVLKGKAHKNINILDKNDPVNSIPLNESKRLLRPTFAELVYNYNCNKKYENKGGLW